MRDVKKYTAAVARAQTTLNKAKAAQATAEAALKAAPRN